MAEARTEVPFNYKTTVRSTAKQEETEIETRFKPTEF